jgi:hypothetical protein
VNYFNLLTQRCAGGTEEAREETHMRIAGFWAENETELDKDRNHVAAFFKLSVP